MDLTDFALCSCWGGFWASASGATGARLGDALGFQLWLFLYLMLNVIFLILDILKYMKVYEGIWRLFKVYGGYLRYMKVYEGPPMVSGDSPLITAPLHRCQR